MTAVAISVALHGLAVAICALMWTDAASRRQPHRPPDAPIQIALARDSPAPPRIPAVRPDDGAIPAVFAHLGPVCADETLPELEADASAFGLDAAPPAERWSSSIAVEGLSPWTRRDGGVLPSALPRRVAVRGAGDGDGSEGPLCAARDPPDGVSTLPPAPAPPPQHVPACEPAQVLSAPPPEYPERARDDGVEGVVRLVAEILEDGAVGEIVVMESSGVRALDDAAVRAVKRWTFAPAREEGVAVRSHVRVPPIRFRLRR